MPPPAPTRRRSLPLLPADQGLGGKTPGVKAGLAGGHCVRAPRTGGGPYAEHSASIARSLQYWHQPPAELRRERARPPASAADANRPPLDRGSGRYYALIARLDVLLGADGSAYTYDLSTPTSGGRSPRDRKRPTPSRHRRQTHHGIRRRGPRLHWLGLSSTGCAPVRADRGTAQQAQNRHTHRAGRPDRPAPATCSKPSPATSAATEQLRRLNKTTLEELPTSSSARTDSTTVPNPDPGSAG